ncbi:MAG: Hsp20/alpha crystallin family protein, partial [Verrucomicrobiia bacterium]
QPTRCSTGSGTTHPNLFATPMNATTETTQRETSTERQRYITPVTSIRQTTDGGYLIEAEMPGVGKDDIHVSLDVNELTLVGHRSLPNLEGKAIYREIPRADFRRVFELDAMIDRDRIAAKIENGVLKVTLPLAEAVKPRQITVEG